MASVTIDLDVPEGVSIRGYERHGEGHAFEVDWDCPPETKCDKCGQIEASEIRYKETVYVVRDLDVWGQPAFLVYRPPYHTCSRCGHRQHLLPPFKRKDVTYTYRYEQFVLHLLIGSTEEEVARRVGISAETVGLIVENQLADKRPIDPERKITDVGLDEISLKKGHKLYVTLLTDLTDPKQPRLLAVAKGRDQAAAEECLAKLSPSQREQIKCHRTDMCSAYAAACEAMLKNSQLVIDRFHVAKRLGEVVDDIRKKLPATTKRNSRPKSESSFAAACGNSAPSSRPAPTFPKDY